jgi:hypothetical protein
LITLDHALGLGGGGLRVDAVLGEKLDLAAGDPAGGVDLLDGQLRGLDGELAERPEEAGARRQVADADDVRLPLRQGWPRQGGRKERGATGSQKAAARQGIPEPIRHRCAPVRFLQPGF